MNADDRTAMPDPDRTLLVPRPGGQETVVMRRPLPGGAVKSNAGIDLQRLVAGVNPLLGAANSLLALVPQLRLTMAHADPAGLRQQLLERVGQFEEQTRANGVPAPKISAARYLLCSFMDEVVAATPWGASGIWAERNLLQEFHEERSGGDKAFKLLERLGEDVAANADLLELYYVCLALGFEGRYRGAPNGRAQLDAIAERVADIVSPAGGGKDSRTLSLRWQGAPAQRSRTLAVLPLWVVLAVGASLVLGVWLLLSTRLEASSHPLFQQIHGVSAALRVERGAQSVAAKPRLAPLLQADVTSAAVEVRDEALRSLATLSADSLFVEGTAEIDPARTGVLERLARALAPMPGEVVVVGHTDDTPTRSLRFPTNWHLSSERAQAVMDALARHGVAASRLRAEGRADAEPIAPNDSVANRARNRRVEVRLLLPRPEAAS